MRINVSDKVWKEEKYFFNWCFWSNNKVIVVVPQDEKNPNSKEETFFVEISGYMGPQTERNSIVVSSHFKVEYYYKMLQIYMCIHIYIYIYISTHTCHNWNENIISELSKFF